MLNSEEIELDFNKLRVQVITLGGWRQVPWTWWVLGNNPFTSKWWTSDEWKQINRRIDQQEAFEEVHEQVKILCQTMLENDKVQRRALYRGEKTEDEEEEGQEEQESWVQRDEILYG